MSQRDTKFFKIFINKGPSHSIISLRGINFNNKVTTPSLKMPHTMHHLLREHHILMNTVKKDKPDMLGGIINEMIDFNQFTIALASASAPM